jgi:hypothetical protein
MIAQDGQEVALGHGSNKASVSSLAKRALLRDIMRLCVFFGQEHTLNSLIPLLIAFLNDKVSSERGVG